MGVVLKMGLDKREAACGRCATLHPRMSRVHQSDEDETKREGTLMKAWMDGQGEDEQGERERGRAKQWHRRIDEEI